jgi:glycosyltransferase involved in cell wall biosynthesis
MKTLAIDLTYASFGGADTQISHILRNIDVYDFDKFIIYMNTNNSHLFDVNNKNIFLVNVKFISKSLVLRILWQQLILPFRLIFDKASVLFSPGNISPILSFTNKAQWIGTIGPFEKQFYMYFSIKNKIFLYLNKFLMKSSSFTSKHVFFESKYTFDLFIEKYNFNSSKGSVINIGLSEAFFPIDNYMEPKISPFVHKNFILTVSHLYPYKNIEVLLRAFSKYSINDNDQLLLIAGAMPFKDYYHSLCELSDSLKISDKVIFLGKMNQSELRELYNLCTLFVFTSPFENFAYTLVEAMSCGAPILATNTTAMPETCGDSAIYFNPYSPTDLVKKITKFMSDPSYSDKYKKLSIRQSKTINNYRDVNIKTNNVLSNISSSKNIF